MGFGDYKEKRVLVTGGSGFVGSRLSASLASRGAHVYNLDLNKPMFNDNPHVNFCQVDLTNRTDVFSAITSIKPEIVFHLAADICRASEFDMLYRMIDTNLVETI